MRFFSNPLQDSGVPRFSGSSSVVNGGKWKTISSSYPISIDFIKIESLITSPGKRLHVDDR